MTSTTRRRPSRAWRPPGARARHRAGHRLGAVAAIAALALAGCGQAAGPSGSASSSRSPRFEGVELAQPVAKPEFVMTDTGGRPFDFAKETKGRLTLLYFGYTHCPDVCPTHMAQIAAVLHRDPSFEAKVVFVTVDPARDTPKRLRSWLDNFDTSFVGLTGTPARIKAAETATGLPLSLAFPDGSFGHAAEVLAYAPNGWGYTEYPFGTRQSQYAHDLPELATLTRPPVTASTTEVSQ